MTKRIANLASAIAFGGLFALCLSFVGIRVSGHATFIVTGGSMEPSIAKGSLVLVQPVSPSTVRVGDVITFEQYGQTTTHRVIAITSDARGPVFETKGDANVAADPEDKTFAGQVGLVRVTIPVAGYVVATVQAYWRLALTLLAAILFFGCAAVLVFRTEPRVERAPAPIAVRRRPVLVTVDADEAWRAHLLWLQRQRQTARAA